MKFSSAIVLAIAASASASTWFGKTVYNKWHETELERWLSDHNVPYPTPADRKDLENLIKNNWNDKVVTPYNEWETPQLQAYLKLKGHQAQSKTEQNKNALVNQVKGSWTETADGATSSYASVRDWIFDSWTDSQLKAFADKHGIPVPQPRKRDSLLKTLRENYETAAKKVSETTAYPGNWIYETWSESDLKQWLDERGIPAPQPSTRDKLVASVRRNSRIASQQVNDAVAAASSSAAAAQSNAAEAILDGWSDSQIKKWADKNGIKVPQGSKRNELLAIARKNYAALVGDTAASTASSYFGAATSNANNQYARATDDAQLKSEHAFDEAVGSWSDSRLKGYLDSRGVPVPQGGKRDELLSKVRLNKHKASTGFSAWTFDTWTTDNIKKWLSTQNKKGGAKAGASRDEVIKSAQSAYATASKAGGDRFASVTSYLTSATDSAKDTTFDTWSESELKNYLDSYGISTYQGSTKNELKAAARRNANYFRYGTTTPQGTLWAKISDSAQWVLDQLKIGASSGRKEAEYNAEKAGDYVNEKATAGKHRAGEAGQTATDKVKEEL